MWWRRWFCGESIGDGAGLLAANLEDLSRSAARVTIEGGGSVGEGDDRDFELSNLLLFFCTDENSFWYNVYLFKLFLHRVVA